MESDKNVDTIRIHSFILNSYETRSKCVTSVYVSELHIRVSEIVFRVKDKSRSTVILKRVLRNDDESFAFKKI